MEDTKTIIGVYKITNTISGRYYIGYSKDIEKRFSIHRYKLNRNIHDNVFLQRAYNLDGINNFNYEILHRYETIKEAQEKELIYLNDLNIRNVLYNLNFNNSGGDITSMHPDKDQIYKRISATLLKKNSELSVDERKLKWGFKGEKNGMFGKTHTESARKKISELNKGNHTFLGCKHSDESKKKLSEYAKLRIGEKNQFFGKHHSEETKKKISDSNKKRIPKNTTSISIDNITYSSMTEAANKLNIPVSTVSWRIRSKNQKFNNYKYTEIIDTSI